MEIEITYGLNDKQILLSIHLPENATVKQALEKSNIQAQFPDIDLGRNKVGIFGKIVSLNHILRNKDRIEIYRPLIIDPKQARLNRAIERKKSS